jgi:hypothetical protein
MSTLAATLTASLATLQHQIAEQVSATLNIAPAAKRAKALSKPCVVLSVLISESCPGQDIDLISTTAKQFVAQYT